MFVGTLSVSSGTYLKKNLSSYLYLFIDFRNDFSGFSPCNMQDKQSETEWTLFLCGREQSLMFLSLVLKCLYKHRWTHTNHVSHTTKLYYQIKTEYQIVYDITTHPLVTLHYIWCWYTLATLYLNQISYFTYTLFRFVTHNLFLRQRIPAFDI